MNNKPKIAMLILAAGEAKRMQAIKQLLPWKNTTLLGNTIEQGLNTKANDVFVVLGANSEKIKESISNYDIQIIENKNWKLGLGSSISCAINCFKDKQLNYDALLISLADQPLIPSEYYNLLIDQFSTNKEKIITSNIKNKPSVPAIFDASYFEALSKLNEDKGAKKLLQSVPNDVLIINTDIKLIDVDTDESYKAILNDFGRN